MKGELTAVFEQLERERGLDRSTMISALKAAMVSAARRHLADDQEIYIDIDAKTFDMHCLITKEVVDRVKDRGSEIDVYDARKLKEDAEVGDIVFTELPAADLGRIAAQTFKQSMVQKLRQAEKERILEDYEDRIGDIVSGMVRRFDRNDVVIDIGNAEALLYGKERVPTEEYQVGERIRCYILMIKQLPQGPEIVLSRSHPDFLRRLFELEVAEIADGTVEIKGIAREAGFRSKVAVWSADEKIDPVGACVGMRGIRVKNIVRELNGEKIDIVRYNPDVRTYITEALKPARISKLEINESTHTVKVIVDPDQLSLAIGKKGQNARLTAKLTNWKVDITKDESAMDFEERVTKAVNDLKRI